MCDINNIIERVLAGDVSALRRCNYGDYLSLPEDTQGYLNAALEARRRFDSLPSAVKQAYPSPDALLSAFSSPEGLKSLERLGVVKLSDIVPTPVVTPEGAEPSQTVKSSTTTPIT